MSHFQDKRTEFAAYRMLMVGVNLIFDMIVVLLIAVLVPQISSVTMCCICLITIVASLVFQVHIDHTLIFTGEFLIEDTEALYAVIGCFGLGFGKRRRKNKKINAYRCHYIHKVKKIDNRPYGIRVEAEVYMSADTPVNTDKTIFDDAGAMKAILLEQGKKKRVVFRIEHNLTEEEEKRLLKKLEILKEGGSRYSAKLEEQPGI